MAQQAIKDSDSILDAVRHPGADVQNNRRVIFQLQDFLTNDIPDAAKFVPEIKHHFAPGMYAREMFMPKGALIVGKIHKHEHLTTLAYGKCEVATDQQIVVLEGPLTFSSPVGVKRVIYAHTDLLWTTYHATHETDLAAIEKELIAETYDDIQLLEVAP